MSDSSGRTSARADYFLHQPFGLGYVLTRGIYEAGRPFQLDVLLNADGGRGILPDHLIPEAQRDDAGMTSRFPVMVHELRGDDVPIVIHADRFVELEEDPGAIFTELLDHEKSDVRYHTCRLLTNLNSYRIEYGSLLTKLIATLADPDPLVRWYAAWAMGKVVIPGAKAVDAILTRMGREEDYLVAVFVGTVLRDWLINDELPESLREGFGSGVRRLLRHRNATLRSLAVVILELLDKSYERPTWRELMDGTAPAPAKPVDDHLVRALVADLTDGNDLRRQLASYRLALLGPSVCSRLSEFMQTDDELLFSQLANVFSLIEFSSPETVPLLLRAALTHENESCRHVAADCLTTIISHGDLLQEVLAHSIPGLVKGVSDAPWWCAPGQQFQLEAADAIRRLDWLARNSDDKIVWKAAVQAIGLIHAEPLLAARTLSKIRQECEMLFSVLSAMKLLGPALEPEVPSLKEAIIRGIPDEDINWHFDALLAAGAPGAAAIRRLQWRFSLSPNVRKRLISSLDILRAQDRERLNESRRNPVAREPQSQSFGWVYLLLLTAAFAAFAWVMKNW